ncbi:MAG: tetratricopeptide repeat protein [Thermoguttaceae bacterium]|jgi:tetratricopeptide (TPR) repeat protein|nr:tetratricopeptide repeat protein [Thermoguttaceae bacterium]
MCFSYLLIMTALMGQGRETALPERSPPSLKDVDHIYVAHFAKSVPGVHLHENLLFVIVELELTDDVPRHRLHGRRMSEVRILLRQYVAGHRLPGTWKRLQDPLLRQDPGLLEICRSVDPLFAVPLLDFKIAARVLEDRKIDTRYRYVMVMERDEFDGQIDNESITVPDLETTLTCLRKVLDRWREQGNWMRVAELMFRLGAIEDGLRAVNDESALDFPLASYGRLPVDSLQAFAQYRDAEAKFQDNDLNETAVVGVLRQLPGMPPALAWLADRYSDRESWPKAVNASFLALAGATEREARTRALLASLDRWCNGEAEASPVREYRKLVVRWLDSEFPASLCVERPGARQVALVWRSFGHLNLPKESVGQERAPELAAIEPPGVDDAIGQRLCRIANRPNDSRNWASLGRILQEQEEPMAAIACYNQAVRLDPDCAEARMSLATCYDDLGFLALARGAATAALLVAKPTWEGAPQARELLERIPRDEENHRPD